MPENNDHDDENGVTDATELEVIDPDDDSVPPPSRYNISSYGWDSDVEGLVKRLNRGDIFVPGFQRGFVWTGAEKSRFIESLILGLPVPNVFLAQDSQTKNLNIVDGQQRLRSLQDFLKGEFFLTGSEIQEDLKGCYFSKDVAKSSTSKVLSNSDARTLSDAVLHSIVIKPDPVFDDAQLGHEYNEGIIQIFKRLNTSGKPLQAQEIRASIYYGPLDTLIRELNGDVNWRKLFGKEHPRLKDMELILRYIALSENWKNYKSPMPKFLNKFMECNRDLDKSRIDEIRKSFIRITKALVETIGNDGLRSGRTLVVSKFDAVMAGYGVYLDKNANSITAEALLECLDSLETDDVYKWAIDEFVNDTNRVIKRIERARSIFESE